MASKEEPLKPATRDQLPRSLFGRQHVQLRRYNQRELEALASRPQKILPIPDEMPDAKKRQLSGLAQYRGRSEEGNKASLGNLPRVVKMDPIQSSPPALSPGVPIPDVPMVAPRVHWSKTLRGKYTRVTLSKEEVDLYWSTWDEWMSAHPEYDNPDDRDELSTVCMETVNMWRLQRAQQEKPTMNISEAYNQAFRRKEVAKENLSNRRRDRKADKSQNNKGTVINVAVVAGGMSPQMKAQRQQRAIVDQEKEEMLLEHTVRRPPMVDGELVDDDK